MKRAALFLFLGLGALWADPPEVNYQNRLGIATAQPLRWFASGTVPGTLGVQTDTLIGDHNKNDTTVAVDIAGAQYVSVTIITASKGANSTNNMVRYYGQVADSNATTAAWHTLPSYRNLGEGCGACTAANDMVWSVYNSAATADTINWVFLTPDTLKRTGISSGLTVWGHPSSDAGGGTQVLPGVTVGTHSALSMVRTSRHLRLIADPTHYPGDTSYVRAVITRIYPR